MSPARSSSRNVRPSLRALATVPSWVRTAARLRSASSSTAEGLSDSTASERPSIGSTASPASTPNAPIEVSTAGDGSTRVTRTDTSEAAMGVPSTVICTSLMPAVARLRTSWVCMRSSVVRSRLSAARGSCTCAMPSDESVTERPTNESSSGKALRTAPASQALGCPSTRAVAIRLATSGRGTTARRGR